MNKSRRKGLPGWSYAMKKNWIKKNAFFRIMFECKKQWGWLLSFVFIYFLAGVFKSWIALMFGNMTDAALTRGADAALGYVMPLVVLLGAEWLRGALTYIVTAQTTERIFFDMKRRIFEKLNRVPINIIEERLRLGDIVSRVNNDLNSLCEDLAGQYTWFMRVFFTAVIAFIACVRLSWQLSLVYFLLIPPAFWLVNRISKPMKEKQKAALTGIGSGMNLVGEALDAAVMVKSYNLEGELDSRFGETMDRVSLAEIENEKKSAQMLAVRYIGVVLPMALMLFFGIFLVRKGIVSPGTVIAFASLCGSVRGLLEISHTILKTWRRSLATSERIYEILDLPAESSGEITASDGKKDSPAVSFGDFSFSYNENIPVLKGITIKVQKGQRVALVGRSGCGKSTLVKLICKFYEPDSRMAGRVKLWGIPLEKWDNEALRAGMALVCQDSFIFQDTIRCNVSCRADGADDEKIIQALRAANIWEFVERLPERLDTRIGDGGLQLSGGQKQRIAIARAFYKDAPLLLLDEPTAALDVQAEKEVWSSLDRLSEGRTTIIITHRLYTLENVDNICVLENGRLAEEGKWDELLNRKGLFYHFVQTQTKEGAVQ